MMSRKSKHRVGEMHGENHHHADAADAGDDDDDDDDDDRHHPFARKGSFALESFLRRQHAAHAVASAHRDIDSVESLVVHAAVITALLASFVVANIVGNTRDGEWDKLMFKQALYSWPNHKFQEFVIWTLEQEGVAMTVQLDAHYSFDLAETIRGFRHNKIMSFGGQRPDVEMVLEWVFPRFPIANLRAWFVHHEVDFDRMKTQSIGGSFYTLTTIAVVLAMVAVVASLSAYVSLTLSGARDDATGAVLKEWAKIGVPATLFICESHHVALSILLLSIWIIRCRRAPCSRDQISWDFAACVSMSPAWAR